jgi:2-oxoglutarate dehydrogenase E2 component (dihydrolipoamide succinyltransferase)
MKVGAALGLAAQSVSPAVRRLLAERGLDVSEVRGTGQGGRVTVADVIAHGTIKVAPGTAALAIGAATHADGRNSSAGDSATSGGGVNAGAVNAGVAGNLDATGVSAVGPSRRVPHTATRKRIAEHMVQSLLHTAPHVTTVFEADLTAVLEHRKRNKEEFARRGAPLTLTAYFLQATVAAIRAVPEANSRWTDSALEIYDSKHIGVATALETGLVVPVLRDVQARDLFETAKGLEDLVSRAREGRLAPADMRGGTFTISNHGVSGSLVATPIIINQPQAAILGIGKLEKRPVVSSDEDGGEDRIVIRPRCYVTLTIDHRVMDGHQANRFLQTFVERLVTSLG